MAAMLLDFLSQLKNFLADRPEYAFLAISLATNVYLTRKLFKVMDGQLAQAMQLAPLTERLTLMVQKAAVRSRGRVAQETPALPPASDEKNEAK